MFHCVSFSGLRNLLSLHLPHLHRVTWGVRCRDHSTRIHHSSDSQRSVFSRIAQLLWRMSQHPTYHLPQGFISIVKLERTLFLEQTLFIEGSQHWDLKPSPGFWLMILKSRMVFEAHGLTLGFQGCSPASSVLGIWEVSQRMRVFFFSHSLSFFE